MNIVKGEIQDDIMLCVLHALNGEIYKNIVAIATSFDSQSKEIHIINYLDREPTEYDEESINAIADCISDYCFEEILHYKLECRRATAPVAELDHLQELVFAKRGY